MSIPEGKSNGDVDPAIHSLAISISREINLVNPNDLLAKRVLDLALQHDTLPAFQKAAKTFGRFRDVFLQEVWMDARANKFTAAGAKALEAPSGGLNGSRAAGSSSSNGTNGQNGDGPEGETKLMLGNIVIEDSEVMMPPKQAPGGLLRPGGGLSRASSAGSDTGSGRASPRESSLGLDRLAAEKRKERLASESGSDRDSKRSRYDSEEDSNDSDSMGPQFKSECRYSLPSLALVLTLSIANLLHVR
jgi:pre-mRNA-splicing factor ATP-dependent RNA helicase DHX38/PRP16